MVSYSYSFHICPIQQRGKKKLLIFLVNGSFSPLLNIVRAAGLWMSLQNL